MKENEKEGDSKIKMFDFQKFMVEYNITKESLDQNLVRMIEIVEGHISEAEKNCKGSTCVQITTQLQLFADFIMNEVWEFVQVNGLPEETESDEVAEEEEQEKEELNVLEQQLQFLDEKYNQGHRKIEASILEKIGIESDQLNKRLFEHEHYLFSRALMSSEWTMYKKSVSKDSKEVTKEEE